MLIRSQDKKLLINLNNIESIGICGYKVDSKNVHEDAENANTWYISCAAQDYSPFIGYYSSEAKAIKVLDMIQNAYECSFETTVDMGVTCPKYSQVLQMPPDDKEEG